MHLFFWFARSHVRTFDRTFVHKSTIVHESSSFDSTYVRSIAHSLVQSNARTFARVCTFVHVCTFAPLHVCTFARSHVPSNVRTFGSPFTRSIERSCTLDRTFVHVFLIRACLHVCAHACGDVYSWCTRARRTGRKFGSGEFGEISPLSAAPPSSAWLAAHRLPLQLHSFEPRAGGEFSITTCESLPA